MSTSEDGFPFRSLIDADQITPEIADRVFQVADDMRNIMRMKGRIDLLSDKIIGLLFFEPSSRTMLSFQSAAQRLQAGVIFAQGKEESSLKKGESISDTIRVTAGYCDAIVMRHPSAGAARMAAEASDVPFINAGDGSNEHPTQSLIDAYTIMQEIGHLNGLHVAMGLDPLQSRSIHSLARLLSHYEDVTITFVAPPSLRPAGELVDVLQQRGVTVQQTDDLSEACSADVLYLNRLQEERFADPREFAELRHQYQLTKAILAGRTPLLLDPLPRIDEIAYEVDSMPNAKYIQQAHFGVPIRMALLTLLLRRAL